MSKRIRGCNKVADPFHLVRDFHNNEPDIHTGSVNIIHADLIETINRCLNLCLGLADMCALQIHIIARLTV